MSQQIINLGLIPNDGSGDALRVGAQKINENFTELYERGIPEQAGNNGKVLTTSGTVLRWDRVTDITGNAATVTNGVYTTGSYNNPSWLTGLAPSKVLPNQSGNTGKYLTTDGATLSWVDLETVSVFDYNNLLNRPVFPDNTSDLVNDSGFITSSALTGYATETYVNSRGFITNNGLPSQTSNTGKYLTTDGTSLSWATVASSTDRLVNGLNEVILDANGIISHNGSFTKTTNNFLNTNVATQVVWTSTQDGISGVKLTIQVECDETGGVNYPNWETQVCEAIIAVRGYNSTSEPVMSVYGVTHTSVAPLMTFSVQRNPTTFLIEIVGTRTATASPLGGADLRIYSVETGTND